MEPGTYAAFAAVIGALAGTGVTWRLGDKRFDHERSLADRDAIGAILEDAAVELHEIAYILDDIRSGLNGRPLTYFHVVDGNGAYRRLEHAGKGSDARTERLTIRLRDDPAATTFKEASESALAIYKAAKTVFDETRDVPIDPQAKAAVREAVDEKVTAIEVGRSKFDSARERFREAAYLAVGVKSGQ